MGFNIQEEDPQVRLLVRRTSKAFLVWSGKIFHGTFKGPRLIQVKSERTRILRPIHYTIGNLDALTTKTFVAERF